MENLSARLFSRRALLQGGSLFLLAGLSDLGAAAQATILAEEKPALSIGLVTDIHYADTPERGTRFYRDSIEKLAQAVEEMNRRKVAFGIEIGDMIDALPAPGSASEIRFLKRINAEFKHLRADRHYVLGNHCVYSLTKQQFLEGIERPRPYYSFDNGGYHFIVLDGCCRKDGVDYGNRNFEWTDTDIPVVQREWLKADLKATKRKTIVFVHQRLDLAPEEDHTIKSALEVRRILESSRRVLAVFQGHHHLNDLKQINDIPYITLHAMVEKAGLGLRRIWTIDLPLLRGQIRLLAVLTIIGTLQDFGSILVLTGGGPGLATHVPALHMYYQAFRFGHYGYASAIGFVLFLTILAFTVANMRFARSTVEAV